MVRARNGADANEMAAVDAAMGQRCRQDLASPRRSGRPVRGRASTVLYGYAVPYGSTTRARLRAARETSAPSSEPLPAPDASAPGFP